MDRVLVYHVTCDARAGIHTTQRNESLNSLIKGGNVFASALMDMSFYQTNCYLVDLQDKFLESALDEITELLRQDRAYCPKIRALIQKNLEHSIDKCCGRDGWAVVPSADSEGQHVVTELTGRMTRTHTVTFTGNNDKAVSCDCHEFTRMEVTCPGIIAVLKSKGEDVFDVKWLPLHWRLSYHPMWKMAMLRLAPAAFDAEPEQHHDEVQEQQAIVTRHAKVSSIPTPSTSNMRRAQMNDAFNSLREDFNVPDCPDKYRQVMASFFDLRAIFNGTPGQWLRDAPPPDSRIIHEWNGDTRAPPPINMANAYKHKPATVQASMTRSAENKKRKEGQLPTVEDRRLQSGDWTLYTATNSAPFFTCPLPGCMKKPIKNTDQNRHHHRSSKKHRALLQKYPKAPGSSTQQPGAAPGIPAGGASDDCSGGAAASAASVSGAVAAPAAAGGEAASAASVSDEPGIPAGEDTDAAAGIPGDDSFKHVSGITDSMLEEVNTKCPTYENMPKNAYVERAILFMDAAQKRRRAGAAAASGFEASSDDDDDEADDSELASLQMQCNHQCLDYDVTTSKEELRAKLLHRATFYARLGQISNSDETQPKSSGTILSSYCSSTPSSEPVSLP